MSDTFSLILGAALVVAAVAITLFLYLSSRRSSTGPRTEHDQAERDARSQVEAAQGAKIRNTGRGAGL